MDFYNRFYFYVDITVLKDPDTLSLFQELAERHCSMYLYAHDAWEVEEVRSLETFEYICDVVFGSDMCLTVKENMKNKKQKAKQVLLISAENIHDEDLNICHALHENKVDMAHVLEEKNRRQRKTAHLVFGVIAFCIVYIALLFYFLDTLPMIMKEGNLAFLLFTIPFDIMLFAFLYGIKNGVIRFSALLDLLDVFS